MKKAIIVINEQHSLFPQQEELLRKYYGENWSLLKVPARGWSLREQAEVAARLAVQHFGMRGDSAAWRLAEGVGIDVESIIASNTFSHADIIFASPVPVLLATLSATAAESYAVFRDADPVPRVLVFHNDRREKVELPNGRIIQRIAREGWVLVDVTTGQVLD